MEAHESPEQGLEAFRTRFTKAAMTAGRTTERTSMFASVSKKALALAAAALATASIAAVEAPAHASTTTPRPLPVTFAHDGTTGSAGFASNGNVTLDIGNGTYAQVSVDVAALGMNTAPKTAPSFTTDNYKAGSPRWVIVLANGNFIDGYPAQLGSAAKADFTGNQWAVGNSGTYESYAAALTGANDPLGNVAVSEAYIVEDADQAPSTTDTLTNVQYDGETAVAPAPAPQAPYTYGGHTVKVNNNDAEVSWNESTTGWPDPQAKCEQVWISGYKFGAWNPKDPTNPGTSHVGFTCDRNGSNVGYGFLSGLVRHHTYALRFVPCTTESWGNRAQAKPIPGASVGYVDVFTPVN